jgi:hypothetical protein
VPYSPDDTWNDPNLWAQLEEKGWKVEEKTVEGKDYVELTSPDGHEFWAGKDKPIGQGNVDWLNSLGVYKERQVSAPDAAKTGLGMR